MNILEEVKNNYEYMVAHRRHLHLHPEVTGEEVKTLRYIHEELERLGIEHVEVPDGGIVGFIHGGRPGKTVLLRADMDALPMEENPKNLCGDKICVSQNPGVSHACGHDAHTAMLLGEAKILMEHRQDMQGEIVLCFERGEEGGGQVKELLRYLVRDRKVPVDTCYATHVKWDVQSGTVAVQPGAVMAGAYGFEIRLTGQSGHGSRPDLGRSALDCFAAIYQDMNMLRMKYVSPYDILTFSIGTVQCGTKRNIVPEELTFAGTIRTFNVEGAGSPFMEKFLESVRKNAELFGCEWQVLHMPKPLYECYNNPACAQLARQAVEKTLGAGAVAKTLPWMASESMNMYLKLWPGVLSFTGILNEKQGSGANHHTPEFDVDEEAMITGAAAAIGYVEEFLACEEEIPFTPYTGTLDDLVERNL